MAASVAAHCDLRFMRFSRAGNHRPTSHVADIATIGPPPFHQVGELPAGIASAIAADVGVIVSSNQGLSLHTHDLSQCSWQRPIAGGRHDFVSDGDRVFIGPADGMVLEIVAATGEVFRQ